MYWGHWLKISTALNPRENGKTSHFCGTEEYCVWSRTCLYVEFLCINPDRERRNKGLTVLWMWICTIYCRHYWILPPSTASKTSQSRWGRAMYGNDAHMTNNDDHPQIKVLGLAGVIVLEVDQYLWCLEELWFPVLRGCHCLHPGLDEIVGWRAGQGCILLSRQSDVNCPHPCGACLNWVEAEDDSLGHGVVMPVVGIASCHQQGWEVIMEGMKWPPTWSRQQSCTVGRQCAFGWHWQLLRQWRWSMAVMVTAVGGNDSNSGGWNCQRQLTADNCGLGWQKTAVAGVRHLEEDGAAVDWE